MYSYRLEEKYRGCLYVCLSVSVCVSRTVWRNYWVDFDETLQEKSHPGLGMRVLFLINLTKR